MLHSIGRPSRVALTFLAALALLLAALGSISAVRATEQASCPEVVKDRVTDLWYSVTRGTDNLVVTSLDDVHQGDLVEAHFTVVEGCEDVHVQINSYTASGVTHETSMPQKLFDQAEGTFGPGQQALGPISIPDCFFQADVVVTAAVGEGEGRALLDATLQGENACTEAPDLRVNKGPDGGTLPSGEILTFTITVRNLGNGTAHGVIIEDVLPSGFSWSESPDKAQCSIADEVLSCSIGDLVPEASFSVKVSTRTDSEDCGLVENVATASADDADEVSNRGTVTVTCEEGGTPTPTPEQEEKGSTGTPTPTPEQKEKGSTGTPAASVPDSAVSPNGASPISTIGFGLVLLASLAGLAFANVKGARSRR